MCDSYIKHATSDRYGKDCNKRFLCTPAPEKLNKLLIQSPSDLLSHFWGPLCLCGNSVSVG